MVGGAAHNDTGVTFPYRIMDKTTTHDANTPHLWIAPVTLPAGSRVTGIVLPNNPKCHIFAATIAQAKLFNMDPSGSVLKEERLRALAGDGGIQECGFAQNCVQACPKQLPLTEAISDMGRDVFVQQVKDLFAR